jgi:hypothetical protein
MNNMKKYCTPTVWSSRLYAEMNFCNSTQGKLPDWDYQDVYSEEEE